MHLAALKPIYQRGTPGGVFRGKVAATPRDPGFRDWSPNLTIRLNNEGVVGCWADRRHPHRHYEGREECWRIPIAVNAQPWCVARTEADW